MDMQVVASVVTILAPTIIGSALASFSIELDGAAAVCTAVMGLAMVLSPWLFFFSMAV